MARDPAIRITQLDRLIDETRQRIAENAQLARTAAPRSRFAYAAAATKGRGKLARLTAEYDALVRASNLGTVTREPRSPLNYRKGH